MATKIDKVLGNHLLLKKLPNLNVMDISNALSDHIPIFVKFNEGFIGEKGKLFIYLNSWHSFEGYSEYVHDAINTNYIGTY